MIKMINLSGMEVVDGTLDHFLVDIPMCRVTNSPNLHLYLKESHGQRTNEFVGEPNTFFMGGKLRLSFSDARSITISMIEDKVRRVSEWIDAADSRVRDSGKVTRE